MVSMPEKSVANVIRLCGGEVMEVGRRCENIGERERVNGGGGEGSRVVSATITHTIYVGALPVLGVPECCVLKKPNWTW